MLPTASRLKAVPISRKANGEGQGGGKTEIVNGPALNKGRKAYPLERDVDKRATAKMIWERVDMLNYIGSGVYRDAERFGVLPKMDRNLCINTKRLIMLTAYSTCNRRECSWEPQQSLYLKKK